MKPTTRELVVFAMLGSVMYASKLIMEFAPNIHLIGVFTIAFTVVYRKKALYPLYICPDDRFIERFCDMVDPLSVPVDCPVGRCHAPSRKHAGKV